MKCLPEGRSERSRRVTSLIERFSAVPARLGAVSSRVSRTYSGTKSEQYCSLQELKGHQPVERSATGAVEQHAFIRSRGRRRTSSALAFRRPKTPIRCRQNNGMMSASRSDINRGRRSTTTLIGNASATCKRSGTYASGAASNRPLHASSGERTVMTAIHPSSELDEMQDPMLSALPMNARSD